MFFGVVIFVLLKAYKVIKQDILKSLINVLKYDNSIMNYKKIISALLNLHVKIVSRLSLKVKLLIVLC